MVGASSQSAVIGRMWRLGAKRPARLQAQNHSGALLTRRALKDAELQAKVKSPFQGVLPNFAGRPRTSPPLIEQPLPQQTPVLCSPRPWMSREDWECAYPVAGEAASALSCCNTPTVRGYCHAHRNAMFRKPRESLLLVAQAVAARGG
jgi:hypothetical protein